MFTLEWGSGDGGSVWALDRRPPGSTSIPAPTGVQEGEMEATFEKGSLHSSYGVCHLLPGWAEGTRRLERGKELWGTQGDLAQAIAPSLLLAWRQSHFCPGWARSSVKGDREAPRSAPKPPRGGAQAQCLRRGEPERRPEDHRGDPVQPSGAPCNHAPLEDGLYLGDTAGP